LELGADRAKNVETRHLLVSEPGAIAKTAELLKRGHLVVFPTDTLYGLGAIAFNGEAVIRLYQVKGRPLQKGIPVLLADLADLKKVASSVPAAARSLIDRFWPGPLTLVVPKHPDLPAVISPNDGVAVRIPNSEVTRALIRAAGGAVATSSANASGRTPACTAAEALAWLGGHVAAVLDDGPCPEGVASTIVDCRGEVPLIVREGPIPAAALKLSETLAP
jgi:L-threonylcarbamoyladenylate synthase